MMEKSHWDHIIKNGKNKTVPIEIVQMDVLEPMSHLSFGNILHDLGIIDYFTAKTDGYIAG